MKIYTQTFDLAKPVSKMFSVARHSAFGIGIKIVKDGVAVDDAFEVQANGETLTPEADKISGFTVYLLNAGDDAVVYTVACNGQTFKLTQGVTDSAVFEKPAGGGGIAGTGFLDFSSLSSVPMASTTLSLTDSGADYKIIVADSLYTDWTTNPFWSGVADKIVSASDYIAVMTPNGGQDEMDD